MMNKINFIGLVLIGSLLISACDQKGGSVKKIFSSEATCVNESSQKTIQELLTEAVEEEARKFNKALGENRRIDLAKIRAITNKIDIELMDVITTKNDPNSTKKFCEARISFKVPDDILKDVNELRKNISRGNIESFAEDAGYSVELGTFKRKISYNVQQTDNKEKIYTEIENSSIFINLLSEIAISAALNEIRIEASQSSLAIAQEKIQQEQIQPAPNNARNIPDDTQERRQPNEKKIKINVGIHDVSMRACAGIKCELLAVLRKNSPITSGVLEKKEVIDPDGNISTWVKISYNGELCAAGQFDMQQGTCNNWTSTGQTVTGWVNLSRLFITESSQ